MFKINLTIIIRVIIHYKPFHMPFNYTSVQLRKVSMQDMYIFIMECGLVVGNSICISWLLNQFGHVWFFFLFFFIVPLSNNEVGPLHQIILTNVHRMITYEKIELIVQCYHNTWHMWVSISKHDSLPNTYDSSILEVFDHERVWRHKAPRYLVQ